jgi:hypothetical protein
MPTRGEGCRKREEGGESEWLARWGKREKSDDEFSADELFGVWWRRENLKRKAQGRRHVPDQRRYQVGKGRSGRGCPFVPTLLSIPIPSPVPNPIAREENEAQ